MSGNIPEIVQPQFIDPGENVDESCAAPRGGATHENLLEQITADRDRDRDCDSDGGNDSQGTGVRAVVDACKSWAGHQLCLQ